MNFSSEEQETEKNGGNSPSAWNLEEPWVAGSDCEGDERLWWRLKLVKSDYERREGLWFFGKHYEKLKLTEKV